MLKFITKLIVPLAIVGVIVLAPEPVKVITIVLVLFTIVLFGAAAIWNGAK